MQCTVYALPVTATTHASENRQEGRAQLQVDIQKSSTTIWVMKKNVLLYIVLILIAAVVKEIPALSTT